MCTKDVLFNFEGVATSFMEASFLADAILLFEGWPFLDWLVKDVSSPLLGWLSTIKRSRLFNEPDLRWGCFCERTLATPILQSRVSTLPFCESHAWPLFIKKCHDVLMPRECHMHSMHTWCVRSMWFSYFSLSGALCLATNKTPTSHNPPAINFCLLVVFARISHSFGARCYFSHAFMRSFNYCHLSMSAGMHVRQTLATSLSFIIHHESSPRH